MNSKNEALVSIVIPVYNASEYLDSCMETIVNQTYSNIELILENDGSTDDSLFLCQHWAQKDTRIRLFTHENQGVSATRNHGLAQCKGRYVSFIDADDLVASSFIETMVQMIEQCEADCAVVNWISSSQFDTKYFSKGTVTTRENDEIAPILWGWCQGFLCNKLYRTDIIREYSLEIEPSIAVSEDLLFNASYLKKCRKVALYDGVQYFYRQQGGSASNRLNNERWFDCLKVYERLDIIFNDDEKVKKVIDFAHESLLLQAAYRLKYVGRDLELEMQIKEKVRTIESRNHDFTFKQRIKLLLLKHFPHYVMIYKRRMIK